MKIFTSYEIYELVSAEHAAQEVTKESGYGSDYDSFIYSPNIEKKLTILENNGELKKFEDSLSKVAKECTPLFDELPNLNNDDSENDDDDSENVEEFLESIHEIQDEITDKALEELSDYCE